MIFKKISFSALTLFIILSGCGFKPIKMENISKISLAELKMIGNENVNFEIGSYLKQVLSYKKDKLIKIKVIINSKKEKTVKEKNNKNEITKYNLTVISNVKVDILETNKNFAFTITKLNEYKVAERHSTTLQNEKKSINEITNNLSQDIADNILLGLNDN